ncbi:MAG: UDP-3-O-acyl-N-acetylglucosamine deacetylase [Alphaproteobacteria bacterium]|nr:UDP-3-O-acyl-N-acetylglucosamine deacetylase [Alphaproteobacteria bacterium]
MQNTVSKALTMSGVGLHSGRHITMTLEPAPVFSGISFVRTDLTEGDNVIPALWDHVVDTKLCTVVGNVDGANVGTIEHLMSALRGCGIDNLIIKIDGPEVPIMDGSAMPFIEAIEAAGITAQAAPRRVLKVLKEVSVEQDGKRVTLAPSETFTFAGQIDFNRGGIGSQAFETSLVNGNFRHDIAQARTFGFLNEVEYLRTQGLALGGSMSNAIVLGDDGVMNPEGLRFEDEFIRHKLLDAIGDLYLAGAPILGRYDGFKAGHAMNNAILHALFASKENWTFIDENSATQDQTRLEPAFAA